MNADIKKLGEQAKTYAKQLETLQQEVGKVIVGQETVVEKLLIALISNGHILLEGVPGLAKTLAIKTLAQCLELDFQRIQFTPDLLPADITGTKIYNHKKSEFTTNKGPIFSNFILADEINRAPPKVQSALLEAMQEKQVTIGEETYQLAQPFLVLATQNPIESEGTYQLPEAQLDRFMFKLTITYPTKQQEEEIITRMSVGKTITPKKVMNKKTLETIRQFLYTIYLDDTIKTYIAELVDATRHYKDYDLAFDNIVDYGVSPRASLWLALGAKAVALLRGRGYVKPEDVQYIVKDVFRHRIILGFEAQVKQEHVDSIVEQILQNVPVP